MFQKLNYNCYDCGVICYDVVDDGEIIGSIFLESYDYEEYINKFIAFYKLKNLNVAANLFFFLRNRYGTIDKIKSIYIRAKYPNLYDEMEKYKVLL